MFYFKYFSTAANISDSDIAALNSIITGFTGTNPFTTSSLSTLVFSTAYTTSASISALGALTGWSTAQVIFNVYYFIIQLITEAKKLEIKLKLKCWQNQINFEDLISILLAQNFSYNNK